MSDQAPGETVKDDSSSAAAATTALASTAKQDLDAWEKVSAQFNGKRNSEFFDPCQDFADKSLKCLYRNGGDKTMCSDYFQAYRDCKKEWTLRRRAAGFTR